MKNVNYWALGALASLAVLSSCSDDDETVQAPQVQNVQGETTNVGSNGGTARTWARTTGGKVDQVGITMNEAAYSELTASSAPAMLMLDYPEVVKDQTGIEHGGLDWNPNGHDPDPIYTSPHFDFHFFMLEHHDISQIPGGVDTVAVNPSYIPAGFGYGPPDTPANSVPQMGVHYVDFASPEFNGGTFSKTFIYGFSRGNLVFIEPMITKAFLDSHPNASEAIKQPAAVQRTGLLYPRKYTVRHDSASGDYHVLLEDFVAR